jgi:hypothetical protein
MDERMRIMSAYKGVIGVLSENRVLPRLIFILTVAAAAFFLAHLRWSLTREYVPGSLVPLLHGKGSIPFQYRALVPWAAGLLLKLGKSMSLTDNSLKVYHLMEIFSCFFLLMAFRYYISLFIKNSAASAVLSFSLLYPIFFNYVFPNHFSIYEYQSVLPGAYNSVMLFNLYYPYDMPSVMFFTIGLILIYKKNWHLYYPLFLVATFNRETTCFLTLVYLFTAFGKDGKMKIAVHCAAQFVIWMAVKYTLYRIYGSNPGLGFESGIAHNVRTLMDPSQYYFVFSNMGFIWIPVLLFYRRIRDDFARRSLLVAIPFLVAVFVGAKFTELRDFGELIPVVLTAFLLIIRELMASEDSVSPAKSYDLS